MICGAALAAFATAAPALAQEDTEVEAVVITGSRIARQDYVANSPIATVTGEQAVANADVTLDTYLNTLPQVNPAGTTTSNNPSNNGQSNIDLRGLGANRNIVLLDGRRPMVSANSLTVDINTIPAAMIENIEVITGGAGATYGADAVAGAVNIKLKKNFEGIDVRASYTNSTEFWDSEEYNFSAVIGGNFADGKGNAVFGFDRSYRQPITKGQREFSAIATSTTGTPPEGALRWNAASGGNTANPVPLAAIQALFAQPSYGSVAPNGVTSQSGLIGFNTDGTLIYYGVSDNNGPLQVQNYKYPIDISVNTRFFPDFYSYNFDAPNLLTLPLDRYSFLFKTNYELDNGVELWAQAGWTEYNAATALAPSPVPGVATVAQGENTALQVGSSLVTPSVFNAQGTRTSGCGTFSNNAIGGGNPNPVGFSACSVGTNLIVPVTNPFIPADLAILLAARTGDDNRIIGSGATEPFLFGFRPLAFGARLQNFQNTVVQFAGGVKVPLSDTWNFEAYVSEGRTEIDNLQTGNVETQRLTDVLANPATAGSGACATWNPFGENPMPQSCINYLASPVAQRTELTQNIAQAFVGGDLFELPAGAVPLVFGAEYRGFQYSSRYLSSPGPFSGFNVGDPDAGSNAFYDLFAETLIPIVKDLPFIQSLEVGIGARYSWSEFEDQINDVSVAPSGSASYKAELSWVATDYARVRASYQRAVRAPNFQELFQSSVSFPQIFDPCNNYGAQRAANPAQMQALCIATGIAPANYASHVSAPGGQAQIELDGNTDLGPEKANTFTIGLVLSSPWDNQWLNTLRGSIDYYSIEVKDAIITPDTNAAIAACFNYFGTNPTFSAADPFCAGLNRSGTIQSVDNVATGGAFTAVNGGAIETTGLDFQLEYRYDWEWMGLPSWMGSVQSNLLLTHVMKYEQSDAPGFPMIDYTGTISFFGAGLGTSFPEWKGTWNTRFTLGEIGYGFSGFALDTRVRYIDGMQNRMTALYPGETYFGTAGVSVGVPATWYVDMAGTWAVNDSVEFKLGVNNVADQQPRLYSPNVQSGTDPSSYDVVGRRVFGQIKLRF